MSTITDFSVPPVRRQERFQATVTGREQLTDSMVRVTFSCPQWVDFDFPTCTDTYMKLILPGPDGQPVMRSYTIRHADAVSGSVDIDFVVHGDHGVAGVWASTAQAGDTVTFAGVGGGYAPSLQATAHLLVGDESALPAIAVALEALADSADVTVFLEVEAPGHEVPVAHREKVTWLYRQGKAHGAALVHACEELGAVPAGTQVFLHGEAMAVREIRRSLRAMGVPRQAMSVSGYWRAGASDEQWRESKAQWKRRVQADEEALRSSDS